MSSPDLQPSFGAGLRAVILDEWALFRQGVASVLAALGIEVVAQASTTAETLLRLWSARPDMLVAGNPADGRLHDVVMQARGAYPELRVLALLPVSEAAELRPVLASGADAVITRTAEPGELEEALRKMVAGERVVATEVLSVLMGLLSPGAGDRWEAGAGTAGGDAPPLTPKELEVLVLLTKDLTNREIARSLVVSEATVKSHLGRLYEKLGVPGRRDAVRRGIELGILS